MDTIIINLRYVRCSDEVAHVQESQLSLAKVYNILKNATEVVSEYFAKPAVRVFPCIGNHDMWPADEVPGQENAPYYKALLSKVGWRRLLPTEAHSTFRTGITQRSGGLCAE